jgi:hypothetical protein
LDWFVQTFLSKVGFQASRIYHYYYHILRVEWGLRREKLPLGAEKALEFH